MLAVNTILKWNDEENVERVLWIDNNLDVAYLIDINENKYPKKRRISEISDDINDGYIQFDSDPYLKVIDEYDIPTSYKELREKAWEIIKDIVIHEPNIFIGKKRRKYILKLCELHGVNESTISKYLKRYWIRGKVKNALLPDFMLCGGRNIDKKTNNIKIGRPRKNVAILGTGINVDENMKQIFRMSVNKYYNNTSKPSLKVTYEMMLKEYFTDDFKIQDNIRIPLLKSDEIPTLRQFRYWFQKDRNIKNEIKNRKNLKTYEQNHRAIIGNSTAEAIGPGSIYQIDATIGDVYLVSRFNRNWIIGRPVIYIVMDVFSRMIVGLYIGLEGPSWIGVMEALANAAISKKAFCKEYGIEISEDQWPVNYLPDSILADRELIGYKIENLINSLHIKVSNTAPYRADWKGIIEKNFHLIQEQVRPLLPGSINQDLQRGDRNYRLDAKLDVKQVTEAIIRCVLYHNNSHYLSNYSREEMMIKEEVEPIPIKLWNWGIKNRSGRLRSVDEDVIKLSLMPTDKATITAKGIKFKGMYYGSKQSIKERWFELARNNGTWQVTVAYDMRNMNYIYIKDIKSNGFEKCFLLEHEHKYINKSFEEIQHLIEYERFEEKKNVNKEVQSKMQLISEIEDIVSLAKKETESEKCKISNNKRIKDIDINRKIEKTINRKEKSFELNIVKDNNETEIINLDLTDLEKANFNDLNFLKIKQKEALKKKL